MAGIKYTKKWQFVRNLYPDLRYFHPAYILEFGLVKILKYPQEFGKDVAGSDWLMMDGSHVGPLFTLRVSWPKWKRIGKFYFTLRSPGLINYLKKLGNR